MMQKEDEFSGYDVLIVGLGPVGMLAANLLGMYGLKVAVFERNQELYNIPRAIHIDDEVMRILQYVGLHEPVLALSKPVPGMRLVTPRGKVLLETSKTATAGFAASYLFYQPHLEQVLMEGVERYKNVSVFFGATAVAIQPDNTPALQVKTAEKTCTYLGKFILACDGANSSLRDLLQLRLKDLRFSRRNLKVDVRIEDEGETFKFSDWIQKTVAPPNKSHVFLNSFGSHYRWEFSIPKGSSSASIEWASPGIIQDMLATVINPDKVKIIHAVEYRFATKIARQWQQDRVFLAGDAAHQMPPYIGQGMCAGFRDVMNISWKIKAVIKDQAPLQLLQSYAVERVPHVRFIMWVTRWVGRLFITRRWGWVLKGLALFAPRHWRKVKVPPQKLKQGIFGKNRRLRGHLFPQMEVTLANQTHLQDACLGKGWCIVSYGQEVSQALPADTLQRLTQLGVSFCIIATADAVNNEEGNPTDRYGRYQQWFTKHKVEVVVVRPDRYIYDATQTAKLPQVIQRLLKEVYPV
ncbi:bifunctional 3-(3-hydroxy-phenyl)propionate/3-hydroxycinnamic acid hydroxylase [Microscilla marina]|uniref:FAD binding domain protein n=1 Tax=Microscilla marina ATCC 23134 TaxID=313606 RepID=A1ZT89_MICM2|nr:bifunctional 3-(3-hydroxy-phenyl)propionate/3-hydroxycinnamic acid hydroxylase [Microscilla marina]EAY26479.1 FAD binding domain protein [Microscilla marina ATCC 23134]